MQALTQSHGLPALRRPRPLAQVEVLLLFHPCAQTGGSGAFLRTPVPMPTRASSLGMFMEMVA